MPFTLLQPLSLLNICCCALVPNKAETRPKPKRAEAVFINWRPPESQMQQRARHVRAVVFSAEIASLRFGKVTEKLLIERKVKKQNISGTFIPGLIVCTKNKKKKSKSKYNREKCPISIERKKC